MSSRRANDEPAVQHDVYDSQGTIVGAAMPSNIGHVYIHPVYLRGKPVQLPFYVSPHPNNSKLASHMGGLALRALLGR